MRPLTDTDVRPAQQSPRKRTLKKEKPTFVGHRFYRKNRRDIAAITQLLKRALHTKKVSHSDVVRLAVTYLHGLLCTGDPWNTLDTGILAAWPKRQPKTVTSKKS